MTAFLPPAHHSELAKSHGCDGREGTQLNRDDLVPGTDGLPARVVGRWVDRKTHFVDGYAAMFATGMKAHWSRRVYVEPFAGPGQSWNKGRLEFVAGSALRALKHDFTDYVFVDHDPHAMAALETRIDRLCPLPGKTVHLLPAQDCNEAISQIRRHVPADALTLAFIDPTNWQIRLDSIQRLVAGRRVDLLVTFHAGSMKRMRLVQSAPLNAFFGTSSWRACLDSARWEVVDCLLQLYNEQLEVFDYEPDSFRVRASIENSLSVEMYELVLFSKHPRGLDLWRKNLARAESGQGGFWAP